MSDLRVAVFGDLLYDCFFWADRLPRMGETVTGRASGFFASGKGGNQAAMCARLGAHVQMLGKVGDDARGAFLLDTMRKSGVDVCGVIVSAKDATGTDCVIVDRDGHNAIVVSPNANATVTAAEVDAMRARFESAQTALFQLQINSDAVARAMRLARDCACRVILNPAPAWRAFRKPGSRLADIVTPNETEAEYFTGVYRADMEIGAWRAKARRRNARSRRARDHHHDGRATAPTTAGRTAAFMMSAFRIDPVDSTAAGDAFNGGLAVRLSAGDGIRAAMRYASACGALTATRRGSLPSLPTQSELEAFLNEHTEALI